uniref:Uncharacterized protein n=1 Tax=viral metagenome TaxID=1070528 RepID=A0A6M3XVE8_9ZZZZ
MSLKALQVGSSGTYTDVKVSKDGALLTQEWVLAQVIAGNVFHAYVGQATTPVTLDAAWANTDPDISLDIPDGRLIIPLEVKVVMEAYGTTALFESMTLCSRTLAAASAGTAFVPINMRTRTGGGSNCSCYVGPTVTSGYTTGAFELHRWTYAKAVTIATADDDNSIYPAEFVWSYKDHPAPVLEGNASMQTWATSQAASGYISWYWIELGENDI